MFWSSGSQPCRWWRWARTVARRYGRLRASLAQSGELIGPNDLWIAAHALSLGVPLITHNLRQFSRVPELTVNTWMQTSS